MIAAGVLLVALGVAHSVLGERYILTRLFRRPLPPLFGDDTFTRRTLRFAWHVTSIAWWGLAALLFSRFASAETSLHIVAATCLATAVVAAVGSRGRHLAWLAFLAAAVLIWLAL